MFCTNCGKEIDDKAVVCIGCGVAVKKDQAGEKSWLATLLLCLFLGMFGAHRFYTGHIGSGVLQLLLTLSIVGAFISAPWVLVDFICIIVNSFKTKDGKELCK